MSKSEKGSHTRATRIAQFIAISTLFLGQRNILYVLNAGLGNSVCPDIDVKCLVVNVPPQGDYILVSKPGYSSTPIYIDNGKVGNVPVVKFVNSLGNEDKSTDKPIDNSGNRLVAILALSFLNRQIRGRWSKKQGKNPEHPILDIIRTSLESYAAAAGVGLTALATAFELVNLWYAKLIYTFNQESYHPQNNSTAPVAKVSFSTPTELNSPVHSSIGKKKQSNTNNDDSNQISELYSDRIIDSPGNDEGRKERAKGRAKAYTDYVINVNRAGRKKVKPTDSGIKESDLRKILEAIRNASRTSKSNRQKRLSGRPNNPNDWKNDPDIIDAVFTDDV